MTGIVLGLYVIVLAGGLAVLFRVNIEKTLCMAIFGTIVVLYLCGLLTGNLMVGVYACWIAGMAAFIFLIIMLVKKRAARTHICDVGLLLFVLFLLWSVVFQAGRCFSVTDEFSHWGLVVKNMYLLDVFGNDSRTNVMFVGYPPGTALWQYFACKVVGKMDETIIYIATNLLLFSCSVGMLDGMKKGTIQQKAVSIIFLAVLPVLLSATHFVSIMVDTILGVVFAYVLILGFGRERSLVTRINLCLALTVLSLTKASGVSLTVMAILIILFADGFTGEISRKLWLEYASYVVCGVFLGKYSWSIYLQLSHTRTAWDTTEVTVEHLLDFVQGNSAPYRYQTMNNFIGALWREPISKLTRLSFVGLVVVFAVLGFILYKKLTPEKKKRWMVFCIGLLLGLVIYTVGLLILYLFTYSEAEALGLASFSRYMHTYFIAMFVVAGYVFLCDDMEWSFSPKVWRALFPVSLVCLLGLGMSYRYIEITTTAVAGNVKSTAEERKRYEWMEAYVDNFDIDLDRIGILYADGEKYSSLRVNYMLAPVKCKEIEQSVLCSEKEWEIYVKENKITHLLLVSEQDADACFPKIPGQTGDELHRGLYEVAVTTQGISYKACG